MGAVLSVFFVVYDWLLHTGVIQTKEESILFLIVGLLKLISNLVHAYDCASLETDV